jgi:exosortase/archaeosortase family protein
MLQTFKYFNFNSFLRLIALVLVLYYFFLGYGALVSPEGNQYSAFLDHNLNFIDWYRRTIMLFSNTIAHAFGANSYIASHQMMKLGNNIEFEIWFPCLGFGVMSFWLSFVVNSTSSLKRKIKWAGLGLIAIWLINCFRIALLIISVDRNWPQSSYIDHHDMFNVLAYTIIATFMYYYAKKDRQDLLAHKEAIPASI